MHFVVLLGPFSKRNASFSVILCHSPLFSVILRHSPSFSCLGEQDAKRRIALSLWSSAAPQTHTHTQTDIHTKTHTPTHTQTPHAHTRTHKRHNHTYTAHMITTATIPEIRRCVDLYWQNLKLDSTSPDAQLWFNGLCTVHASPTPNKSRPLVRNKCEKLLYKPQARLRPRDILRPWKAHRNDEEKTQTRTTTERPENEATAAFIRT